MTTSTYALILAGGSGERFWPLSRRSRPKQLLRLVSKNALLEETVTRLEGWIPRDQILILTNVEQESAVREMLKDFPTQNILAEPAKRDNGDDTVHHVLRFREKPNVELAESFLRKGNFRWNAGMFVWPVPTVLSEFNRHAPDLADFISQLRAPGKFEKVLRERFNSLPRVSFDYAIMEKADRVLVVEAKFDWDDVGSWRAVAKYFQDDAHGNASRGAVTAVDSTNNIVFDQTGSTVALLGVHNLIVVRTNDAVLVCHRHQAERIKDLVSKLPPELQ